MAFLGSILRALAPLALEHGTPMLRDWWKARAGQTRIDPSQQMAADVDQLKAHAGQVDATLDALNTNLEKLNSGLTAREERQRKWLLALCFWNIALTVTVVVLAAFAIRH